MADTFANGEYGVCSTQGATTSEYTIPNGNIFIERNNLQNLSANGPTTLSDQLSTQVTQQNNIKTNKDEHATSIIAPITIQPKSQTTELPRENNIQQIDKRIGRTNQPEPEKFLIAVLPVNIVEQSTKLRIPEP